MKTRNLLISFIAGLLFPLGFAPFHLSGITIISLGMLYFINRNDTSCSSFKSGFLYGMGAFTFGVSWVIVSIHDYGNINYLLSGIATLLFVMYLSLFPGLVTYGFTRLKSNNLPFFNLILFSSLWTLSEILRSRFLTGFPWLLSGTIQVDTPMKTIAPVLGVYGLSFLTCLAAGLIVEGLLNRRKFYLVLMASLFVIPGLIPSQAWTTQHKDPLSVAVIQANLSMRDKWDEALFWKMLSHYKKATEKLLGTDLIVLPESAIPLPSNYLEDYLDELNQEAALKQSALMLGILKPVDEEETHFYNTIAAYGEAEGEYIKRHLVPFGEYIPGPFQPLFRIFHLPDANLKPGVAHQDLVMVKGYPVASLICYEIAYPELLRKLLPSARWIVSISDDGWFGHSFASYQQLQMAQMTSLISARYQVIANNDGLSAVIDPQGQIIESLPAFKPGILEAHLYPVSGLTPWAYWGDHPVVIFCLFFLIFALISSKFSLEFKSSLAAKLK